MSDVLPYDPRPSFFTAAAALWLLGFCFALMPLEACEAESFMLAVLCVGFSTFFTLAAAPIAAIRASIQTPIVLMALGFWALALLSVALSEIPFVSFIYFCFLSVFPLSFFITVIQGGHERFLKIVGYGLAALFAALSVSSLIQYFVLPDMLFHGFVSWPLANPNALAALLSLGFFGAVGSMLGAPDRRQSNLALALASLLAASIFVTGSRGALLALLITLAIFLFCARAQAGEHKRCLLALLILSLVSFVLVSIFTPVNSVFSPAELIARSAAGTQPLLWSRFDIWASTWEIIQNHFWTGTGIGTFFLYYPEVRSLGDPSTAGLMAHSDPLQFWAEMGVAALLLFYGFIILAIARTRHVFKALEKNDVRRVTILAPFFALSAMILHAHVSFPFHILPILMIVGLALGFWFVETQKLLEANVEPDTQLHAQAQLRWSLALPVAIMLGVFTSFQASEILMNRAHENMMSGNMDAFVDETNRAGRLSQNYNARAMIAASHVPLGIAQLNGPLMPKAELQKIYDQTAILLDRAQAANPRLAQALYHRAQLHSYVGFFLDISEEETPQALAKRALALDPLHLGSRIFLSKALMRSNQKEKALEVLVGGLHWKYKKQNPRHYLELTMNFARELQNDRARVRAEQVFQKYFPDKIGQ